MAHWRTCVPSPRPCQRYCATLFSRSPAPGVRVISYSWAVACPVYQLKWRIVGDCFFHCFNLSIVTAVQKSVTRNTVSVHVYIQEEKESYPPTSLYKRGAPVSHHCHIHECFVAYLRHVRYTERLASLNQTVKIKARVATEARPDTVREVEAERLDEQYQWHPLVVW